MKSRKRAALTICLGEERVKGSKIGKNDTILAERCRRLIENIRKKTADILRHITRR